MSKCPPCGICGAPAPLAIISRTGTRHACYAHEYDNPTPNKETTP